MTGFAPPNYTQMPNDLFPLMPLMGEAELRVTLAVARATFGWHREEVELSFNKLRLLTGLSKQGVINGVEAGVTRGTLKQIETRGRHGMTYCYSLVVLPDLSTSLTSQPAGPVHEVDRSSAQVVHEVDRSASAPVHEVDRPGPQVVHEVDQSLVNVVDRSTPPRMRVTREKPEAERKGLKKERFKEKESDVREPQAPASEVAAPVAEAPAPEVETRPEASTLSLEKLLEPELPPVSAAVKPGSALDQVLKRIRERDGSLTSPPAALARDGADAPHDGPRSTVLEFRPRPDAVTAQPPSPEKVPAAAAPSPEPEPDPAARAATQEALRKAFGSEWLRGLLSESKLRKVGWLALDAAAVADRHELFRLEFAGQPASAWRTAFINWLDGEAAKLARRKAGGEGAPPVPLAVGMPVEYKRERYVICEEQTGFYLLQHLGAGHTMSVSKANAADVAAIHPIPTGTP